MEPQSTIAGWPRAAPWAWAVGIPLFVLGEMLLFGHRVGLHNHAIQLPYLFWLNDPTLYPGDRLMESMRDYFSYFWLGMAWLTRWLPLEPAFLAIHLLTLAGRYGALWCMARVVAPGRTVAPWIVCWLHLFAETPIGREQLHWFYVAHTSVASMLGLWVLYFTFRRWWWAAFALAGLIFNLHAMQAAYLAMMLAAAWLWTERANLGSAKTLLRGAAMGVVFLLAASPGLAWMLRSGAASSGATGLGELLRSFFPGHFFPSAFTMGNWIALAGYVAMLAIAWRGLARSKETGIGAAQGLALLAFWLLAGIAIEYWEPDFLLKLHVYRSSSYFVVIALVLFGGWLAGVMENLAASRSSFLLPLLAVVVAAPPLMTKPLLATILPVVGVLLAGAAVRWISSRLVRRGGFWAEVPAALVLTAGLVYLGVAQHRERMAWNRQFAWRMGEYQKAAEWARDNTPPDARFLTPPDLAGFRIGSRRAVVWEWFDGAAMLWDAAYCDYWRAHYLQAGAKVRHTHSDFITDRLRWTWHGKPLPELEAIASKENAHYIVHLREDWKPLAERPLPWPDADIVYDDGAIFFIVKVRREASPRAADPTAHPTNPAGT